jgi:two-component system cell cycle sensor histidine kinase/response regulator CckA
MNDQHPTDTPSDRGYYRLLYEHSPVAMIATDGQFRVVACNEAASRLVGVPVATVVGRPLADVVPAARRRLLERLLARTMERGVVSDFEVHLPAAIAPARDLMVVLSPIPGPDGKARGVAAWVVDETHRKRLNERLAQAERMASLGTLAGGVAHHFNNILGGVATFVDFALTSGDGTAMRRALQMTAEAAARASRITQSLLTFAERDKRRADLADLTEVLLTFAHLVERPLEGRKIKIHLDLHPVPIIAVDNNLMHQVLGNLLTNAEEAMPDGGTIAITLDREGDRVVVSFADTGCGIKPEHQPLVFEPFFTTKGLLAGGDQANPGLGLSVVHGLVLEMGGQITLESQLGAGTKFLISYPVPEDTGGMEDGAE